MNKIFYLWNFKPNESSPVPNNVVQHNSNYIPEHRVITPSDIDSFLNDDIFPELSDLYFLIPHWIIKTDLARLLFVYFHGGFYFDTDCFIQKPINKHSANDNVVLFILL